MKIFKMYRKEIMTHFCFVGFIVLSLACASAPEQEIPKTKITIEDLNVWLKNQETNLLATNELTPKQLMEVTKLCISTGEINDVEILEENQILSYAVLSLKIKLNEIPLLVTFSYSISKTGTLKMRINSITETSENSIFSKVLNSTDVDTYKASVIESVSNELKKIGNAVLLRSADFA